MAEGAACCRYDRALTGSQTVRIEHVALWTNELERLRAFYEHYFGARAGAQYRSATRPGLRSYFLTFPDGGSRLELMSAPGLTSRSRSPTVGYTHIALTIGSRADVEALTERMRGDGVRVLSAPRQTGDGYYESVVEDPDGNAVEISGE
jgi:lactoylglutathione lyase